MGRLIYAVIISLDGYIADREGHFGWAEPDEEAHAFINELQRSVGTYLYGRRMYQTMAAWESETALAEQSPIMRDFARTWQAAEKIVYSRTLAEPSTSRTRIERVFDPEAVSRLKAATEADLTVAGPGLAAHALRSRLVDELQVYLAPAVVGGGTPYLPNDIRLDLQLQDQHRFAAGMVHLRYRVRN